MSKEEFVLLIPAIIYGVAIVDLLKTFRLKIYWEISLWGIYMLMSAILLALTLYDQLDAMATSNLALLLVIAQAILFAKAAALITPEENDIDTRSFYEENYRYFVLMVILVYSIALVNEYLIYDDRENLFIRPLGLSMATLSIFWRNRTYRIVILILFIITNFAVLFGFVT